MKRAFLRIAGCVIFGLWLTSCIATRPVHYYALNRPAVTDAPAKADGLVLLVGRIVTPEALEDDRIRYRSGANEVGAYDLHRWADRPGTMVRNLLVQMLRASGNYRDVQEASSSTAGDYLIRGKLLDLEEVDSQGIESRVRLQLELVASKSGQVVWSQSFNRDEPVQGKTMPEVVAALDRNLQHVIGDSAAGIAGFLAARK